MPTFPLNFNGFAPIVVGADWSQVFGLSNDDGTAVTVAGTTFTHELKDNTGTPVASAGELGSVGTVIIAGSTSTVTVNGTVWTFYPVTITYPHSVTAGFVPQIVNYSIEQINGSVITSLFFGTQEIMGVA